MSAELLTFRAALPSWISPAVEAWILHARGAGLSALARATGVPRSTVLRRIRSVETARRDPAIAATLTALAALPAPSNRKDLSHAG